jgi:cell division protein FtsZ
VTPADEAAKDRDVVETPVAVPVTVGAVTESSYDTAFGDDDLDIPDFLK